MNVQITIRKHGLAAFSALFLLLDFIVSGTANAAVTYVQGTSVNSDSSGSLSQAYPSAQAAGNLNVVIVSWNDGVSTVSSVTDSKGNTYVPATAITVDPGTASEQIYYAKNISGATAGSNTVTVTYSATVPYPEIRILEYSGIDTVNPFDVGSGAYGSGSTQNSGSITTSSANEVLVASNDLSGGSTAAGSGYTQRFVTPVNELVEDKIVTTTGSYNATSNQSGTDWWVIQVAAFRAATGTAPAAPTNLANTVVSSSQINLSWTASSGATGYVIQRCQGAGCANFVQIGTSTTASYSDTGLAASTSYSYRIDATNASGTSGLSSITTGVTSASGSVPATPASVAATVVSASQINLSWTASSGATGYVIQRCQAAGCASFVQIGTSTTASYSDTGLAASTSYSYRINATNASGTSGFSSTATAATSTSGSAPTAPTGLTAAVISSSQIVLGWTGSSGATSYAVQRCLGAGCTGFAQIGTSTTPSYGNTGLTAGTSYSYRINAANASGTSDFSNIQSVTTPTGSGVSGSMNYGYDALGRLAQVASPTLSIVQGINYDAAGNITTSAASPINALSIENFSVSQAAPGEQIIIDGSGFSTTTSANTVTINGVPATVVSATATQLVVTVPPTATSGVVKVTVAGVAVTSSQSLVINPASAAPSVTSFSPTSGAAGTVVTITGTNFSSLVTNNKVLLNGRTAIVNTATSSRLVFVVPGSVASGPIQVVTPSGMGASSTAFIVPPNGYAAADVVATGQTTENGTILSLNASVASKPVLALFAGTAGDLYVRAAVYGLAGASAQVLDPSGLVIASTSSVPVLIDLPQLTKTGTYSVVVTAGTSTGSANVGINKAPVRPLDLTWASLNQTTSQNYTRTAFPFSGNQYEIIQVTQSTQQGAPTLSLVDATGTTLWTSPAPTSASPTVTLPSLPASGTYTLFADPGLTGNPTLAFYAGAGATLTIDAAPSFLGIYPNGSSAVTGRATFTGNAGQTVTFRGTHSAYNRGSLPSAYVTMYYRTAPGASPTYLLTSTALSPDYSIQVRSLPITGTYYVDIPFGAGTTSPMNVQVLSAPGGSNAANPAASNQLDLSPLTYTIPNPGQMSVINFAASTSGNVGINLAQSGSPILSFGDVLVVGPGSNGHCISAGNFSTLSAIDTNTASSFYSNNVIQLSGLAAGEYYLYLTPANILYGEPTSQCTGSPLPNVTDSLESTTTTGTLVATVSSALTGTVSGTFGVTSQRLGQGAHYGVSGSVASLAITNSAACNVGAVVHGPNGSSYSLNVNAHSSGSVNTNGASGAYTLDFGPAAGCTLNLSATLN